jgi:hypothetical protein
MYTTRASALKPNPTCHHRESSQRACTSTGHNGFHHSSNFTVRFKVGRFFSFFFLLYVRVTFVTLASKQCVFHPAPHQQSALTAICACGLHGIHANSWKPVAPSIRLIPAHRQRRYTLCRLFGADGGSSEIQFSASLGYMLPQSQATVYGAHRARPARFARPSSPALARLVKTSPTVRVLPARFARPSVGLFFILIGPCPRLTRTC